ncbi:hypothetical protein N7456_008653 [Penicillium angulare]|uniref:NB-ARC domain-containing protein n=1 Tax=Penicillium angulare TaxID=116970 RepID=A0A9W9K5D6_9EURO|nr:hypothetical protein N7456_008653 [Penicillium angulare]
MGYLHDEGTPQSSGAPDLNEQVYVKLNMNSVSFDGTNTGVQVGSNHGVIYLPTMHLLDPLETPPEPPWTVPFSRDPDFVGREPLLDRIHEKASILGSRTAITGLGGVGKTQLAIEYSHRVRCQSADTWVLWIHASSMVRCEKSLRDLANRVKIPGRQDRDVNVFQLVGNWLQETSKWILILDNVDDDELLCKPPAANEQPPLRYLLQGSCGSIILTSRNKSVALDIAGHNIIEVHPMNETDAVGLLQKKLGATRESENMVQLARELECMPLAIVQAASFIMHNPRYSILQYIETFQKSDREAVRLLNREACLLYRDWEAKNSIILTWQISFDYIRKTRPSATNLLSFISFFDPQGIDEDILQAQHSHRLSKTSCPGQHQKGSSSEDNTDNESDSSSDACFEDNITMLTDFALISIGQNCKVFTMHRLIKLTVQLWLKNHQELERWNAEFIHTLRSKFPACQSQEWVDQAGNMEICQSLFPHVKSAMSQQPKSQESLQIWAALLLGGAWYAQKIGNYRLSREMAFISRISRLKLFGEMSDDTLDSTTMLAVAYGSEGQWHEAEKLEVEVLEICKAKLGERHPDTLISMVYLAKTYRNQGRWAEAEKLQVQALDTYKELGGEGPQMSNVMGDLACTYWEQGRLEEAEKLEIEVVEMRKTELGEDHPTTLGIMSNLAATFRYQGRWDEAEQLEVEVMRINKASLGEDHPATVASISNLAATIYSQGRYNEAKELGLSALDLYKTKLGVGHPNTLNSMSCLAATYRAQGQWKDAEILELEVMERSKIKLGDNHPDTILSIANLAATYCYQGQWDKAKRLQIQVMEMSIETLGNSHPNTLSSMSSLAATYRKQGCWEEAEKLALQVMEKDSLGKDHPRTLLNMANLGKIYWGQGRWEEAEQLQVYVMETSKAKLGADHPDTLTSMDDLACTYRKQRRLEEAEELQVQATEMSKKKLGPDHPDTLLSMVNLALIWECTNRHLEAMGLLKLCLSGRQRILGPDHPDTIFTYKTLLEWETG